MRKTPEMTHEELASIRRELGLKQREMAEELGLTIRGYQFAEAGDRNITKQTAILARLLLKLKTVEV